MKVLLVAHHLPPRHVAGTEVYTARLAKALAARHEVLLFATDDDPGLEPGSVRRRSGPGFEIVEVAEPRVVSEPADSWRPRHARAAFAAELGGKIPIIGAGDIASVEDAQAKIAAGASLVQVYTAFIYQGPKLIREIAEGLA